MDGQKVAYPQILGQSNFCTNSSPDFVKFSTVWHFTLLSRFYILSIYYYCYYYYYYFNFLPIIYYYYYYYVVVVVVVIIDIIITVYLPYFDTMVENIYRIQEFVAIFHYD